jgi:hypothetical protein
MVTYSTMPWMIPGSTIRTTGTCGGMAEKSTWSTPAPDENSTFRFGRAASRSGGACHATRYSTSANSPWSGQTWKSTSGACSAKYAAQVRPRAASDR